MERSAAVELSEVEGVGIATLNRPESHNALSVELLDGVSAACAEATRRGLRSLVLAAAGPTFCAGGDLAQVNDILAGDDDATIEGMVDQLHGVIAQLRSMPMPTVAAIAGPAVGAGISLALATDVRVMSRAAVFVTGYASVGASPDGGASFHLSRALGTSQALSSFLLNQKFAADDLLTIGLVSDVVEPLQVLPTAVRLGRKLARLSFPAVAAIRDLVYGAPTRSLPDHLDAEKQQFLTVADTQGFRDGVAPFARSTPLAQEA